MFGKNQRSSCPQMGHVQLYTTQNNSTVQYVARQRTSVGFKLVVRGDTGAGGLVAPLLCTAYFGKTLEQVAWKRLYCVQHTLVS